MFDAELLESVRIISMAAAKLPDWEAAYRRVCRWYSKNLATPLTDVMDLPPEFVFQHFYEDYFLSLEDEQFREQILSAVETPAERAERLSREAATDARIRETAKADFTRMMAAAKKKKPLSPNEAQKIFEDAAKKLDGVLSAAPQTIGGGTPEPSEFRIGE